MLAADLVARSQKVCQKTWMRDWTKARVLLCTAEMLASMSAWFLTRKGWRYVWYTQVEPCRRCNVSAGSWLEGTRSKLIERTCVCGSDRKRRKTVRNSQ